MPAPTKRQKKATAGSITYFPAESPGRKRISRFAKGIDAQVVKKRKDLSVVNQKPGQKAHLRSKWKRLHRRYQNQTPNRDLKIRGPRGNYPNWGRRKAHQAFPEKNG